MDEEEYYDDDEELESESELGDDDMNDGTLELVVQLGEFETGNNYSCNVDFKGEHEIGNIAGMDAQIT